MSTLKETALNYKPKLTLNISDLDKVSLDFPIEDRTAINSDGKEFSYKVMVVNQQEYRVTSTVLEEIQKILKLKPETKYVNVIKTGSGLSTRYSVDLVE